MGDGYSVDKYISTCTIIGSDIVSLPGAGYYLSTQEPATWSLTNMSGGSFTLSTSNNGVNAFVNAVVPLNGQTATLKAVANGRTHTYKIRADILGIIGSNYICQQENYTHYSGQSANWSVSSGFTLSTSSGASTKVTASTYNGQSGTLTAVVGGITYTKTITACGINGPSLVCPSGTFSLNSGKSANWNVSSGFTNTPISGVSTTVTAPSLNGQNGTVMASLNGITVTKTIQASPAITGYPYVCNIGENTFTFVAGEVFQWVVGGPPGVFSIIKQDATTVTVKANSSNGESGAVVALVGTPPNFTTYTKDIIASCPKSGSSEPGNESNSVAYYTVYPNPTSDHLYIEIDAAAHLQDLQSKSARSVPVYDVRLYNGQGTLLRQQKTKGGTVHFNVTHLLYGIYYLHIYDGISDKPVIKHILVDHSIKISKKKIKKDSKTVIKV